MEEETAINNEEINALLKGFSNSSGYVPIPDEDIETIDFDNKLIKFNNLEKNNWLVLSEKYSLFPGWRAVDNNKLNHQIYRANGVISAVYLNSNEEELLFSYKLKSFILGAWISWVGFLALLAILVFHIVKRKKIGQAKSESEPQISIPNRQEEVHKVEVKGVEK